MSQNSEASRYTITAALPYTNGPIHIGHLAGVYVPADIYSRYLRGIGKDVAFVCGSDEHGVAISMKAVEPSLRPNRFQGKRQLRRKENSSQGSRRRLRVRSRHRPPSTRWLGNINPIPFRRTDEESSRSAELSCLLGSAHPCPTAVHMEPFSTSVFRVLIGIFATTTKICTGARFT